MSPAKKSAKAAETAQSAASVHARQQKIAEETRQKQAEARKDAREGKSKDSGGS